MNRVKILVLICLIFSYSVLSQSVSIGLGGGVNFIMGDNYYTNDLGKTGHPYSANAHNFNVTISQS